MSRRILWPVRLSVWVLSPLARLAAWCANTIVRLFGLAPDTSPFAHALSEEEIRAIIAGSTTEGITRERQEMLHNVFEIGDTQVREIMIPRTDVTAIDIAPTALSQARRKARKAGVSVGWLLADVLSPPNLKPFDFIYDRGCYHVVRDQNLVAYLDTVRRYSRPGTQFLLLTGNSNEPARDYGPPRVTEEEIRNDFLSLFDLEWLQESRFEISRPGAVSPLAWSVLLRRKSKP